MKANSERPIGIAFPDAHHMCPDYKVFLTDGVDALHKLRGNNAATEGVINMNLDASIEDIPVS